MTAETQTVKFVIHTDSYSGNFEREMCAFMTHQLGECEVGANMIGLGEPGMSGEAEAWFEEHIVQVEDEGCCRPCSIEVTPGWTNDGKGGHSKVTESNPLDWPAYQSVAIFMDVIPPKDIQQILVDRAYAFVGCAYKSYGRTRRFSKGGPEVSILGFEILVEKTVAPEVRSVKVEVSFSE